MCAAPPIALAATGGASAASKCEHWRSIDLADLKRMGLLKPIVGDRIRAITWNNDYGGFDKLGIIPSARGIQFVKRDDQGKLGGLFVAYTFTTHDVWRLPQVVRALGAGGAPASSMVSTACGVGGAEC